MGFDFVEAAGDFLTPASGHQKNSGALINPEPFPSQTGEVKLPSLFKTCCVLFKNVASKGFDKAFVSRTPERTGKYVRTVGSQKTPAKPCAVVFEINAW